MFVIFRLTTTTLADTQDGDAAFKDTSSSFTLLDLAGEVAVIAAPAGAHEPFATGCHLISPVSYV